MPTTLRHFRRERERAPAATPVGGRLGGGRGIRTPGAIADTTVFKTVSFGHSDSPPDLPHPTGTSGAMPTSRTQPPRTPRENTNTQTSGRHFRGIELERAARTRGMNPAAQAVATMCFMCRAHARGKPQAPEARPHRPRAGVRYPRLPAGLHVRLTPPARGGPLPHGALDRRAVGHTARTRGAGTRTQQSQPTTCTHHACAWGRVM